MIHLKIDIKVIWNQLKGSEFISDYVDLPHYKYHKISQNHGGLYVASPD